MRITIRFALTTLILSTLLIPASIARAEKPQTAAPATIRLVETDWDGVQKIVQRNKGKVVVVDVWTTTCACCLAKFPKFIAMKKKFGNDLALVSVNCDYDGVKTKPPKFYRKGVLTFLQKQNAQIDNVLLTIPFLDFLEKIKLESTPASFVFDANGKLVKRFDNDKVEKEGDEFTVQQVEELVGRLIKQAK